MNNQLKLNHENNPMIRTLKRFYEAPDRNIYGSIQNLFFQCKVLHTSHQQMTQNNHEKIATMNFPQQKTPKRESSKRALQLKNLKHIVHRAVSDMSNKTEISLKKINRKEDMAFSPLRVLLFHYINSFVLSGQIQTYSNDDWQRAAGVILLL